MWTVFHDQQARPFDELGGALARWWTEESASRLQRRMPMALGALAQDGGAAIDNLAAQIPDKDWAALAKEFFLS